MRLRTVSRFWLAGLAVVAGWLMASSEVRAQGGFGGQQGGGQQGGFGGQQGGFGGQQGGFGGQQGGFGNLLGGMSGSGMSGSLAGGFLGSSQGFRPSGNTGLNNRLPGASNSTNPFDAYRGDPRNSGATTGNATGMNNNRTTGNMTGMNNRMGNMTGMNQFGGMNRMGNMGGMNQFGGMNRMGNMSGMGMNGMSGQAVVQPGYVLRPNIEAPPIPPASETAARLQIVLTQSTSLPSLRGLNLRIEGDVIVLSGTVATDSERTLSEAILRLEPGVYRVKNELQVRPTGQ
jgi:hypothetical protein